MNTEQNKEKMLVALQTTYGIITSACNTVGIDRATHYEWLKTDKSYKSKVENIAEEQLDFVETELIRKIKFGETNCVLFYLKTKGKKRGYGDAEIQQPKEGNEYDLTKLNDKELEILQTLKDKMLLATIEFKDFSNSNE